jgi:DNA-binding transcriptional LysR family regulator
MRLDDLVIFVRAVEAGSFAAAARRLGVPKSTVSKRVAELEADLGARLIQRSSRSFVLTDVGRDVLDHARAAALAAEAAEDAVRRRQAEPRGVVRMTASVPIAQGFLATRLPPLAHRFPRLRLVVHVSDRFVDLVQEGFDIALRSHSKPLPDSDLMSRRVETDPVWLVAAPAYLAGRGMPRDPSELGVHDGLTTAAGQVWRLRRGDGAQAEATPEPRMIADESTVLLEAVRAGLGITCLPASMCGSDLRAGRLVRVLPDRTAGTVTTTLLTPHRRGQLPAVRAVIDALSGPTKGSGDLRQASGSCRNDQVRTNFYCESTT